MKTVKKTATTTQNNPSNCNIFKLYIYDRYDISVNVTHDAYADITGKY